VSNALPRVVLQILSGLLDRSSQWQQHRLEHVALAVEQVGAVHRFKTVLGTANQGTCQVAGHLDDLDGHALGALFDGFFPGVGITAVAVALDEDEVGHRFKSHQAGFAAAEVLVRNQCDRLGGHLLGQGGLLAVAEGNEVRLDSSREWMQGTTGGSNEGIELGPFEEGADEADAASPLKLERGHGRENDAAKDRLASGREEEGGNGIVSCG
jgi:hypothetical protein